MERVILLTVTLFIAILLSTSCVSKKKFTAAQNTIDRLRSDSTGFQGNIGQLESELKRTSASFQEYREKCENDKASLLSQLEQRGVELNEKDQALQYRAQRLRALQERLEQQQSIVNRLRTRVEDALVNVKAEDLSVEVKNGKVYISLSDKLLFPSGSANLNKEGKDAIGKLAQVLLNNPEINIDVTGHTDTVPINTPRFKDNWDLSTARATTITRLLTEEYQIKGSRLTASGMSKYNPVATNETKEGRAKNRRTEIILTPKLEELFKILEGDED